MQSNLVYPFSSSTSWRHARAPPRGRRATVGRGVLDANGVRIVCDAEEQKLLKAGAPVDRPEAEKGHAPLMLACATGHSAILKERIHAGAERGPP